jgi:NTE family protein
MRRLIPSLLCAFLLNTFLVTLSIAIDEKQVLTDYLWFRFGRLTAAERPRVAVALGGGGARGMAHVGVLEVFQESRIPVDIIAGTSVGALVGALYSAGTPLDEMENMAENVGWNELSDFSGTTRIRLLLGGSLLSSKKMEKYIAATIGEKRFYDLNIPFACVATDLVTGERVIFRDGEVALAARASATVPGLFDPVEYRHRFLVDGGILDNIPTDVARLMGGQYIIAVSVNGDFSRQAISSVFRVLVQSISIQGKVLDEVRLNDADYVVSPQVGTVSAVDLGRSRECVDAGVSAAWQAVPGIKRSLLDRTTLEYLLR